MCDLRVFRSVYSDFSYARKSYLMFYNDERAVNAISYALQQCVEKLLKAYLECAGVTVPKTHNVGKLVRMSKDNGSRVIVTDWIRDNADTLTVWEASSRYDMDFWVEEYRIRTAIDEVEQFLRVNGICEDLLEEVTDEAKARVREVIPKSMQVNSNLEWNVLVRVFGKQQSSTVENMNSF